MEPENKTEKYLEDNMDMIFGTECMNGSFDIELRNKLENNVLQKQDRTETKPKMNNLDKQYTDLLQDILDNGVKKETRNGSTISVFGRQIRHNMQSGFPLLTTKKMAWKQIVTELLWFLRGDTNIKFLVDNDCHIWDGDAYKNYREKNHILYKDTAWTQEEFINKIKTDDEFAKKWGELGPIYGKQWRRWAKFNEKVYTKQIREVPEGGRFAETRNVNWVGGSEVAYIDQITNLINDLKTNPDSRRLMVNAWNVADLPVTDYRTDDELYQDYLKNFE